MQSNRNTTTAKWWAFASEASKLIRQQSKAVIVPQLLVGKKNGSTYLATYYKIGAFICVAERNILLRLFIRCDEFQHPIWG